MGQEAPETEAIAPSREDLPGSLREESQGLAPRQAMDAEVVPIEGEDRAKAVPICDVDERGIGEVHREVGVLLHQILEAGGGLTDHIESDVDPHTRRVEAAVDAA